MADKQTVPMDPGVAMQAIQSSNLARIGYDPAGQFLYIDFGKSPKPPSIYRYAAVPPKVWDELQAADSKGVYLSSSIKGRFEAVKVTNVE